MRSFSSYILGFLLLSQVPFVALAQSFEVVDPSMNPAEYGIEAGAVEVPSMRTTKAVTFRLPNGSFTAVSDGQEIFTHDERGVLVPISEIGQQTVEGILFHRLPHDVHVTFDLDAPGYTYRVGDHFFRLNFSGHARATLEASNVVRYQLSEHAVLRFTVKGVAVKKAITIDGPVDPTLLQFTLSQDAGLLQHSSLEGGLTLDTASGKTMFRTFAPTLLDGSGTLLHHSITIKPLNKGTYAYEYDPTGLPATYIIDPSTCLLGNPYLTINNAAGAGTAWANLGGASQLSDGSTADNAYTNQFTWNTVPLRATNFGFHLPYSRVDGVTVNIMKKSGPSTFAVDGYVLLVVGGAVNSQANRGDSSNFWSTSLTTKTYGASNDLWGRTFTWRDVNSYSTGADGGPFGVQISSAISIGSPSITAGVYIDGFRMMVSYTVLCSDPNSSTGQLISPNGAQSYYGYACTTNDTATSNTNYSTYGTGASICAFNSCILYPMIGTGSLPATVHAYSDSYVWSGGSYEPMQIDGLHYGWGYYRWWDYYYNGATWDGYWGSFWSNPWGGFGSWWGWWNWWGWWWGGWQDNVKFRKGGYSGTKIADVPMQFYEGCNADGYGWWNDYNNLVYADTSGQKSVFHLNPDYYGYTGSGAKFTLYVPKSVSHDRVRICSGKTTLGCTSSDSWSFLANDQGQIVSTNNGYDTSGISVSISGGYWVIYGVHGTGGEGEDSSGGGGGGTPVPEFSAIGFLLLLVGSGLVVRRWIARR